MSGSYKDNHSHNHKEEDIETRLLYIEKTILDNLEFKIDNNSENFIKIFNIIYDNVTKKEINKPVNTVNNIIIKEIIKYINQHKNMFEVKSNTLPMYENKQEQVQTSNNIFYEYYLNGTPWIQKMNCKSISILTLERYRKYNITDNNNIFLFREILPSDKLLLSEEKQVRIEPGYYTLEEFIYSFNYIIDSLETVSKYRLFYDKVSCKFVLESNNLKDINSLSILKSIDIKQNYFTIVKDNTTMNSIFKFNITELNNTHTWLYNSQEQVFWEDKSNYYKILVNGGSVYIGEINEELPVEIDLDGLVNIENIEISCDNFYIKSSLMKVAMLH